MDIRPIPTKEQMQMLQLRSETFKLKLEKEAQSPDFRKQQIRAFAKDLYKFNDYALLPKLGWLQELKGMFEYAKTKLIARFRK